MSKARTLANLISDNAELADGQISVAEVVGAAPLASPTFTGTASGTFSGPLTGNVTGNLTGAVTGDVTAPEIDLAAIASTISDTAVDVFVYDTSKDSDGGAWRKRTQHTSWYNETLNTSTRGARKEFPAVAVIVAESNQVTIYDGDDPDLPMWMIFPTTSYTTWASVSAMTRTAISMLNGKLGVVTNDGGVLIDYLSDKATLLYNSTTYGLTSSDTIEGRNQASSFTSGMGQSLKLVFWTLNDVAMTVLPNAPIDAATGLPVPTIAVATDGGVSVIKDDGTVVDVVKNAGNNVWTDVSLYQNKLYMASNLNNNGNLYVLDIPSADLSGNPPTGVSVYANGTVPSLIKYPDVMVAGGVTAAGSTSSDRSGLAILSESTPSTTSMVAYTASDYATGHMVGDIKLATLSDTDTTNVVGSNLISNGTFSNTTGWTAINSIISIDSNRLKVADSGGYTKAYASFATVVGKTYTVSVEVAAISGQSAVLAMGHTTPSGSAWNTQTASSSVSPTTLSITRTATHTTMYVELGSEGTNFAIFDNVEARIVEEDRSVNGNGLQVFGSITKTAVATGADLVAYSGFSTGNYLEQPVNSDLTGSYDSCFMGWIKTSSTSQYQYIFSLGSSGSDVFGLAVHITSGYLYAFDNVNSLFASSTNVADGSWHHVCLLHNNGVNKQLFVDGKLVNTSTTSSYTHSNDATYKVGQYHAANYPWQGSLALQRFSKTIPSPEQIAKIYEDEKVLFQDGAQATLYGSSDAVTALAYDDSTELLHVGTSAGRSVFQGLRRVDNTTDAVGAAISASNGLVAED